MFVEEEGSRFGLACLGSRLATGATRLGPGAASCATATAYLARDAMARPASSRRRPDLLAGRRLLRRAARRAGPRPRRPGRAGRAWPAAIWPHGRYRFDFTGEANHAGTTRMEDRHDPMLSYAMTALAANKQARLAGQRATFGRIDVHPNGTNAVPSA